MVDGPGGPGTSRWLFPGGQPGQPISACRLAERLRQLGLRPGQARSTALFGLATELPAALLARLLGIHISVPGITRTAARSPGDRGSRQAGGRLLLRYRMRYWPARTAPPTPPANRSSTPPAYRAAAASPSLPSTGPSRLTTATVPTFPLVVY